MRISGAEAKRSPLVGRPHRPLAGASPSLGKRLQSRPGEDMGQAGKAFPRVVVRCSGPVAMVGPEFEERKK